MKYRIPEPGTTISGFADNNNKKKLMPTDPRFFWHVTVNTHIYFFLAELFGYIYYKQTSLEGVIAPFD